MKNEIKNNIVHFFIGATVCACVFVITHMCWHCLPMVLVCHAVVLAVSIAIEIFQFFAWDNRELRIVDRIFDVLGYQVGCGMIVGYTRFILG